MDYLITGATGLIGRHLLFELLAENARNNNQSIIHLIVRDKDGISGKERINRILADPESPDFIRTFKINDLKKQIQVHNVDITSSDLHHKLSVITSNSLTVIHVAASTNLMQGESAAADVYLNNNLATKNLLRSIPTYKIKSMVYISTAYSCGIQENSLNLEEDYNVLPKSDFRNPYEKNKAEIEDYLLTKCKQLDIALKILRPAVVCGRLIDSPLYCTTKFDVFYGWARFFYKMKRKFEDQKIRLMINPNGTLNIVPVDYVAKVICKALHMDHIKVLNITNYNPPLHKDYLPVMLKKIGINHYEFTDKTPTELSMPEEMYYKSAGKAFGPYLNDQNQQFDCSTLQTEFADIEFNNVLEEFDNLI
ncbi:MAG: SDR family oxidoreductase, partial [Bacteroidales bacterium]|nr:SDR family oxidoreductase [Bacteroidales bacterium]